ncbi:large repetitive protein [Salmonella enterica subsp. arizonae]|uniref:Large repetitive protein n=1 Tax=Salmonella enterica subsp. arizonae TaxID=59203 RepID=A0A379T253_SALER|nr:large repetitive protein [Salmonella enterica subsp. arizonae]
MTMKENTSSTDNTNLKPETISDIKSYKVRGFDLIVTTSNGNTTTLKDGLTNLVLGNVELRDTTGKTINQDHIISSIKTYQLGLDTVYLADKLVSDESTPETTKDESEQQVKDTFADINKALEESLQQKIKEYEELLKQQTTDLKENIQLEKNEQLSQKKEIIDKKAKQELSKNLSLLKKR